MLLSSLLMTFYFVLESDPTTFPMRPPRTLSRIPSGNPCFWWFEASGQSEKFELQESTRKFNKHYAHVFREPSFRGTY